MTETMTVAEYKRSPQNKYGAKRCTIDGITYASKREGKICHELRLAERAGHIRDLQLQPRYKLAVNDILICTYTADAKYFDLRKGPEYGWHVIDVKNPETAKKRDFRRNVRLMKAIHDVDVEVVF